MAVYWIDPHTTTNGTGTFASPWSLANPSRTGLVSGDEIRIKGVALTSLLTATSYTASVTNFTQLTITAGGGLGADFAIDDVVYLPLWDVFAKVTAQSGNLLTFGTMSLPLRDTSVTSLTVRRVNIATYGVSATASYRRMALSSTNNITITDCWTNATTRVTDGTVKTLFNSSGTGTVTLNIGVESEATTPTGWSVDLANTHVMPGRGTVTTTVQAAQSTITYNQVFAAADSTASFVAGAAIPPTYSTTLTVANLNGVRLGACPGRNNVVNIVNWTANSLDSLFGTTNNTNFASATSLTVNLTNITVNSATTSLIQTNRAEPTTINFNGIVDVYGAETTTALLTGYGKLTVTFGGGFSFRASKRTTTKTSITSRVSVVANANTAFGEVYVPTIPLPAGWTATGSEYVVSYAVNVADGSPGHKQPTTLKYSLPNNSAGVAPYGMSSGVNVLATFRDGTAPYELLSVYGNGIVMSASGAPTQTAASYPTATSDATVYRTDGPSLKVNLNTLTSIMWVGGSRAIKTIRVPVKAGSATIISGYVRTDQTTYVNGDCRMSVVLNNVELIGQDMTTTCINAWEPFSLSFTPTITGEVMLVWEMFFSAGSKSYWLDDMTVAF